MKILLTLCRPLFPLDTGGKIRTFNIFSRLTTRAQLHVVSLVDRQRETDAIVQMQAAFPNFTSVFWDEPKHFSAAFYAKFLQSRLSPFPYSLAKYRAPILRDEVERQFRNSFDVLVCDGLPSAAALMDMKARPRVVFERNVEYMILKRRFEKTRNPLVRLLLWDEWQRAYRVEREICRSFDHVVAVSDQDQAVFEKEFSVSNVTAIPTGVDIDYFRPLDMPPKPGNIVFVGSMDWYPNEDGILWFLREAYPMIRSRVPASNLTIVGRSPSPRMMEMTRPDASIEVTGRVDDVRPYLGRAGVVVVPLRIGSGTRIKIFEAMAMARPVVSTTIGAEGLPVEPESEILLEDSPKGFAAAVERVLVHENVRQSIGFAARQKVVREHSWDGVAKRMGEILEQVSQRPVGAKNGKRDGAPAFVL